MISGFLTSVINSLRLRQHIEERLTLIIDFYHLLLRLFLVAKRLLREPIESVPVWCTHYSGYCSRQSRRSRMNWAIMAHIVASITVFVNAPPLYLPRRYAIANARIAPVCNFLCRENGGQQVMFSGIFMLLPIRGFALFN